MRISDTFKSNYLTANDFSGTDGGTFIIREVKLEVMKGRGTAGGRERQEKPVVYFHEFDKGLVLNKVNSQRLVKALGDETNDWVGAKVTLRCVIGEAFGEERDMLRVSDAVK